LRCAVVEGMRRGARKDFAACVVLAFNRPITKHEAKRATSFLREREAAIRKSVGAGDSLVSVGDTPVETPNAVLKTSLTSTGNPAAGPTANSSGDTAQRPVRLRSPLA